MQKISQMLGIFERLAQNFYIFVVHTTKSDMNPRTNNSSLVIVLARGIVEMLKCQYNCHNILPFGFIVCNNLRRALVCALGPMSK